MCRFSFYDRKNFKSDLQRNRLSLSNNRYKNKKDNGVQYRDGLKDSDILFPGEGRLIVNKR